MKRTISSKYDLVIANDETKIPLFGLDFLGILDRGTNILEIKPYTICNLRCKYCFVSAGDYSQNFSIDLSYFSKWIQKAIEIKKVNDLEIHFAPYGEILLYPELFNVIKVVRANPSVKTISAQTNGLLLTPEIIDNLQTAGLDRLNISLNSLDASQCAQLCGVSNYDLDKLLNMFEQILCSKMDLLIAPVWFMGINDQGILKILNYAKEKELQGYHWPKLRLGIQNYLTYRSGRKLRKVHSREFQYFYHRLQELEKQYSLKLKLGPNDFGIHKTEAIIPPVKIDEIFSVEILMKGRWENEYIGHLDYEWGVKVLSERPLKKGQKILCKAIKSSLSGNLITAIPE